MIDIEILRSGETMVSHISGETDAGVEFVDGYTPEHPLAAVGMQVIDSGRIILPNEDVDDLVSACKERGLTVERLEGT